MRRPLPYHMPSKGESFLGFFLVFFFSQLSAICFYALTYRLFHLFGAVFLAVPAPAKRKYIPQHISVVCWDLDLCQNSYSRRDYSKPISGFFYHHCAEHHRGRIDDLFPFFIFFLIAG